MKKKIYVALLIMGIILAGISGYIFSQHISENNKQNQSAKEDSNTKTELSASTEESNTTEPLKTEEASTSDNLFTTEDALKEAYPNVTEETSETQASQTTEVKKNKKLPKNYEWDEKRWGEPPQIVYDFAENQEKFDYIVNEVNSLIDDGQGFYVDMDGKNPIYYIDSKITNIKTKKKLQSNIKYIIKSTRFYDIVKKKGGDWIMYYNQDEYTEKYIYTMIYRTGMTEEQAYEEGFIKVVGDWYFYSIWKV